MRYKLFFLAALISCALLPQASADWAASFVVYNGGMYTVTEEEIPSESIGDRIGQVTHYSDEEGTYSGNFSNRFPEGTPYYAIQDGLERDRRLAARRRERAGRARRPRRGGNDRLFAAYFGRVRSSVAQVPGERHARRRRSG